MGQTPLDPIYLPFILIYPGWRWNTCDEPGVYRGQFPIIHKQEDRMKTRSLMLFCALLLASASAFAFHCPADMKKIDEALGKKPALSEAQMSEVKKLRADGESQHKAGKHQNSVDTLAKAMKLLGI
jgi:hypothetical protein